MTVAHVFTRGPPSTEQAQRTVEVLVRHPVPDRKGSEPESKKPKKIQRAIGDPRPDRESSFAVDTKKVRRGTAPRLGRYRTGSAADALHTASDPARMRKARRKLLKRVHARSAKGPRRSRLRMVRRLLRRAGHRWLPITADAMKDVAAALRKHRSLANYLCDWRREHVVAGHAWGDGLQALRKDLLRAAARGQGPPRQAQTFGAERLPNETIPEEQPMVEHGPHWPRIMLVVSICWLLRDAESGALLGEQATLDPVRREATLNLGPTKTDPQGRGCERTLGCICGKGIRGPCPYCALAVLLPARTAAGWGRKDPLFPTTAGQAAKSKDVVNTWRRLLRRRLGGHSMRREGAHMYARRDVQLFLIQFLGRWGGDTVTRYVGEALRGQLARAATASATGHASAETALTNQQLKKTIQDIVNEALKKREEQESRIPEIQTDATDETAADPLHVVLAAAAAPPGAPHLPPPRQVRLIRAGREAGETHEVAFADLSFPKETWVARCPWRFGLTPHIFLTGREVTCARCIARRSVEERRQSLSDAVR